MTRLLLDIKCYEKTCGNCIHKRRRDNVQLRIFICGIFKKALIIKSENSKGGLTFYRLKDCIQAEKEYFDLLLQGW